jgi:diguanylate cyclase (GGDEF)-like protein
MKFLAPHPGELAPTVFGNAGDYQMMGSLDRQMEFRALPLWLAVSGSFLLLFLGQFQFVTGWQAIMFLNVGGIGLIACLALSELRRRNGELEILRLRAVATTDPLTGIGNRRSFDQEVNRRMAIFRRYQTNCSLLIIDADHFKAINDTWGHDVGDKVLKLLVRSMQATLRDIDFLFRLGGEEFVALLPETDAARAEIAAERIRSAVSQLRVPVDGQLLQFSVSLGGAQLCTSDNADSWLKRADDALYEAKRTGRNRVVFAKSAGKSVGQVPRPKSMTGAGS